MPDTIRLAANATETDINTALASLSDGGTLILPKDEKILIHDGINVDVGYRNIKIDLNGSTLQQAGDITVIQANGSHVPASAAVIGTDAAGHTTVTYADASNLKAGDWIKVFSDDVVKGDHWDGVEGRATRMGQSVKIASVDGNTVTIDGELVNKQDYVTNIRASQLISGVVTIENGTIAGDQSHGDWTEPLVILKSTINADIENLTVRDGSSMGIHIVDSVNAEVINSTAKNLLNNPGAGQLGYGVHSSMSVGTTVIGLYAENVRHATDNNSWDIPQNYYYAAGYGADIGFTVRDSVTYDNTSYAYSFHSEAIDALMTNVMAFNSYGLFSVRGLDNVVDGAFGANLRYGIQLYEYGNEDGRGNTINNVHAQAISNTAITISNNPLYNIISNSSFESAWTSRTDYGDAATLINTTFKQGIDVTAVKNGTADADVILGTNGADVLSGNGGSDYIWGGEGIDLLSGGGERDSFAYHRLTDGGDLISDFTTGVYGDVLDLAVLARHEGWGDNPIADGELRFVQDGDNTIVEARDSQGQWWQLAALLGVDRDTLTRANLILDLAPAKLDADDAATSLLVWGQSTGDDDPATDPGVSIPVIVDGYIRMVGSTTSANSLRAGDVATMLVGGDAADFLTGGKAGDMLIGGKGADKMSGGLGDDIYQVDDLGDQVIEAASAGYDRVDTTLTSYTIGGNIEALRYIGTGNFTGLGNKLDNTITGGVGNDVLDGDRGIDTLIGGKGDDLYIIKDWSDRIIENAGEGTDTVQTTNTTYSLGENLENVAFIGVGNFAGNGNALDNEIRGGDGKDKIDGGAGSDTMIGGKGDDTYFVDQADDIVLEYAGEGTDTVKTALSGYIIDDNVENLFFTGTGNFNGTGNSIANNIQGGAGNDRLDGKLGADIMTGFAGDDIYVVDNAGDVVNEAANQGTDTVYTTLLAYVLGNNVENVVFQGIGNFGGTGNNAANVITGGNGNDRLDGGGGADTLIGGNGDDIYIIADRMDTISEAANGGHDTVQTSLVSYALDWNVEALVFSGVGDFSGTGNALDNTITGGVGNDTIDGGAGSDIMIGGKGNDTYFVDQANDIVLEYAGEGTDTVKTALSSYTINDNVENLFFIGSGNFNGTGNSIANTIQGGAGNDRLDGKLGADIMTGFAGDDSYMVDNAGDVVNEAANQGTDTVYTTLLAYVLGNNVENVVFQGTGNFVGTGNNAANVITGGNGNDRLDGGGGADTLIGGNGDDTYIIADRLDTISETANGGRDTVQTSLAFYALDTNVEILMFSGTGDFSGTGNALDNTITGSIGNDTLDGGAGADTLIGGKGNDTYFIDNFNDVVVEAENGGVDLVRTVLNTVTLGANVENLRFEGSGNFTGIGNNLANAISGGLGNDLLDGKGGGDTLTGGYGDDTYIIDDISDIIKEYTGQGTDTVITNLKTYTLASTLENLTYSGNSTFQGVGNAFNNTLTGGNQADTLDGGGGNDTLIGGLGDDMLFGGLGRDTFIFHAGDGRDTIADFQIHRGGENGDVIMLYDQSAKTFADIMSHAVQDGSNTMITLDNEVLVLNNVNMSLLTKDDFLLA